MTTLSAAQVVAAAPSVLERLPSPVLTFTLGAATKTLNELRAMHFHSYRKHRKAIAFEVAVLTMRNRPAQPMAKARVRIERHSAGTPDIDGAIGGLKPLLDVLQPWHAKSRPNGLGIILNDSPDCLDLELVMVRCAPRAGKTVVTITELAQ